MVHPARLRVQREVAAKPGAVELAHEVLPAGPTRRGASSHVHVEHPPRAAGLAFHGQLEEVRALPQPVHGALGAEVAERFPAPEVGGGVEADLLLVGERDHHHPAAGGLVPEDLGVAEVPGPDVEHGVPPVLAPRPAGVHAHREVLRLAVVAVPGVDRDEAGGRVGAAEPARVPPVVDGAAGEGHDAVLLPQGEGEVAPAQHVGARRVPPAHVPPDVALGVVLVEEVVLAAEVHEPVRVVHEVARRREVVERPPGVARLRGRRDDRAWQQGRREQRSQDRPCHSFAPAEPAPPVTRGRGRRGRRRRPR